MAARNETVTAPWRHDRTAAGTVTLARMCPGHNLECALQAADRAASHEHPESPRLHGEAHVPAVIPQLVVRQDELDTLRCARSERQAAEPRERPHRPSDARHLILHVELRYLLARALAGVGDGDADPYDLTGRDAQGTQPEIRIRERR